MKYYQFVIAAGLALFTLACKKNSDSPDIKDPFQLPYNKVSVENNKAFLETEGRDFIKKIQSLPDQKGIKALENLADLNAPQVNFEQRQIVNIGRKSQKVGALIKVMTEVNRPSSRKKGLNELYAVYTYNAGTREWAKTASSDRLSFIFPSTANGTTNDANLTLTYSGSGIQADLDEDQFELPAEIKGSLKVGTEEVFNLLSTHTYYTDGLPKTTNTNITLGEYTLTNLFKNENNAAAAVLTIRKAATSIFEWATSSKNKSFNMEQLSNAESIDELISSANSVITVNNVKFATWADIEQFGANTKHFEYPYWGTYFENVDYNDQAALFTAQTNYQKAHDAVLLEEVTLEKQLYQKYTKAVVVNTTTNEIISSIDYEVKSDPQCWTFSNGGEICDANYYLYWLFVFGDGSKVGFDTFGDSGFEKLKTDFENFVDRF